MNRIPEVPMDGFDEKDLTVAPNILSMLKLILKDLKSSKGHGAYMCPKDFNGNINFTCARFLPSVGCADIEPCPCSVYAPEYLIKRLSEIIAFNTKHEQEE